MSKRDGISILRWMKCKSISWLTVGALFFYDIPGRRYVDVDYFHYE